MYEHEPQGFKKPEGRHDEKASENNGTNSHNVNGDANGDGANDYFEQ